MWPNEKNCSKIDMKVHGVNMEILIQANQVPGLELNLSSTENGHYVGRIRIIYRIVSSN